jgi:hypothetical protein
MIQNDGTFCFGCFCLVYNNYYSRFFWIGVGYLNILFVLFFSTFGRDEIIQLRNVKPLVGERKEATDIPPIRDLSDIVPPDFYATTKELTPTSSTELAGVLPDETQDDPVAGDNNDEKTDNQKETKEDTSTEAGSNSSSKDDGDEKDTDDVKDDDSNEAVGKEEAANDDQDMMDDDEKSPEDDKKNIQNVSSRNSKAVTTMFQKILAFGGGGGQMVVNIGDDDDDDDGPTLGQMRTGPNARKPTLIHQGRMVRNYC